MCPDITVAKVHHSGYGARATPSLVSASAARRVRSALLAASAAAATVAAPSRRCLKKIQLQPALSTRLTPSAPM